MEIKEDLFQNVKPGARVHYLTPQGQTRSGTVVMNKGTHLVLNRGGGQPQVVTPKNYIKHSEGGKVKGALLSNLAKSMKEAKEPRSFRNIEDETPILPHVIGMHVLRNKPEHEYSEKKVMQYAKHVNSKFKKDDSFRKKVLSNAKGGNAGRDFLYNYAHKFYDDMLPKTNEEVEQIDEISQKTKDAYVAKRGSQLSSFLYGRQQKNAMTGRQQKNAVKGLKRATGKPVGVNAIASFANKEKTINDIKRKFGYGPVSPVKEEVINELDNKTLLNYVGKAIRQGGNNPYLDVLNISDKNKARARKRAKGLMAANRAFDRNFKAGKTPPEAFMQPKMNNEDAQLDAQKSALAYTTKMQKKKKKRTLKTMKEEIINELGGETLSRYVTKALADRKKQAGMADMAHRIHTPERAKYFADKAADRIAKRGAGIKTAVAKIASNLPAEPLRAHTEGEKSKHGGWSGMGEEFKRGDKVRLKSIWADSGKENEVYTIKHRHWSDDKRHWISDKDGRGFYAHNHQLRTARTWAKDYGKTDEARDSEYRANQQMAGTTPRRAPGHYLTRDGRTLSGPHKPEEAVRAYRDMSDNKNVKIVHVKEANENKMDNDKAGKVAKRAIALAKSKKKTNVNVEPELETPSSQMSQPLLQGAEGPANVRV